MKRFCEISWNQILKSGEDRINSNIADKGKERLDNISKILDCKPHWKSTHLNKVNKRI